MKFSKMEMPVKGKKKSAPKGDSGMDLFAFEGEGEPEAGETAAHEEGESMDFEASEEEGGAVDAMDLTSLSDDEILEEAKKRGLV